MLNANISAINGALLGAAEVVTAQGTTDIPPEVDNTPTKEQSSEEAIVKESEERPNKNSKNEKDNEIINNMLQYFKERFEGNGRE